MFLFYALTYEFLLFFTTLFDFYIFSKRLYENNNAKGPLMAECFSFGKNLLSIEVNSAQDSDLAPSFGDLRQSEKFLRLSHL